MTLYWWMHWFWITSFTILTVYTYGASVSNSQPTAKYHDVEWYSEVSTEGNPARKREGKAIYFSKPVVAPTLLKVNTSSMKTNSSHKEVYQSDEHETDEQQKVEMTKVSEAPIIIKEDKLVDTGQSQDNNSPLALETNKYKPEILLQANQTENITSNISNYPLKNRHFIDSNNSKDIINDLKNISTLNIQKLQLESDVAPTVQPLSSETTVLAQQSKSALNVAEATPKGKITIAAASLDEQSDSKPMDAGVIAGISFAVVVLAALVGATSFVLYRRRYLNNPQTLNDKCSNPDSSAYIDDSTIRENSEEMYSLDNDSFLNSLEAMTIQNYWTDTVKHTKL